MMKRPDDLVTAADFNELVRVIKILSNISGPNVMINSGGIHFREPLRPKATMFYVLVTMISGIPGSETETASFAYQCASLNETVLDARVDVDGVYDETATLRGTDTNPMQPAWVRTVNAVYLPAPDGPFGLAMTNAAGDFQLMQVNELEDYDLACATP